MPFCQWPSNEMNSGVTALIRSKRTTFLNFGMTATTEEKTFFLCIYAWFVPRWYLNTAWAFSGSKGMLTRMGIARQVYLKISLK